MLLLSLTSFSKQTESPTRGVAPRKYNYYTDRKLLTQIRHLNMATTVQNAGSQFSNTADSLRFNQVINKSENLDIKRSASLTSSGASSGVLNGGKKCNGEI